MSKEDQVKILERVKKLLALGESPNEAEASSAVAKAHDLLKQYNLDIKDIEVEDSEVVDEVYMESGRTQSWKVALMINIADANYSLMYDKPKVVGRGQRLKTTSTFRFVGKPQNVAVCMMMADYLLQAIDRLAKGQAGNGRSEIESYKAGVADNLIARLKEMKKKDIIIPDSRALVVQEKAVVDKFVADNLKLKSSPLSSSAKKNWSAYAQGRADGNRIPLNEQIGSRPNSTMVQ
jgi:hypothetical protein